MNTDTARPVALLVYTNPETVARKIDSDGSSIHFWAFRRKPQRIADVKRIYFAAKGRIVAWAEASEDVLEDLLRWTDDLEYEGFAACVAWTDTDAHRLTDGPQVEPFRGFRYLEQEDWPEEAT